MFRTGRLCPGSESVLYSLKTIYQNGKRSTYRKQWFAVGLLSSRDWKGESYNARNRFPVVPVSASRKLS